MKEYLKLIWPRWCGIFIFLFSVLILSIPTGGKFEGIASLSRAEFFVFGFIAIITYEFACFIVDSIVYFIKSQCQK